MHLTNIAIIFCFLLISPSVFKTSYARENPFLFTGSPEPDGKLGAFKQNNTGDCFFLASLIAIAQDDEGKQLIESAFHKRSKLNQWQIIFPNLVNHSVEITQQEITEYKLTDSAGDGFSKPVLGDPDIKILEIAADKIWKNTIKPKGLWDDIPMSAVFMFSKAEQLLIWNPGKARTADIQDIEKYRRIPEGIIKEVKVSSPAQAKEVLKKILLIDNDGISMILIDYINYHALAIDQINFSKNSYSFINTYSKTRYEIELDNLLDGLANGQYAINYLEIGE